jgi:uncharacterized short protein YbdD (DUF466 family)
MRGSRTSSQSRARALARPLAALWRAMRALAGEDAYERYVRHASAQHAGERLLSRRDFYREAERRKWSGVSRCC